MTPDETTEIPAVPVLLGEVDAITPVLSEASPVLVEKGQAGKITTRVEVAEQVRAPVEAGQRLGTLTIQSDGSPLQAVPLVAPEAVARKSWWDVTKELLGQMAFGA